MKELSIEQKAKAYDEALERMKSWVKGEHPECFTEAQKAAEFIFPELKESEDDRIRKDIIRVLKGEISFTSEKENEKYIAWLEKQGTSNPKSALEAWKAMRFEVYQQASGNRHGPNCSDDTTKMFSINDIDEIFEKICEQNPTDKVEPKFCKGAWLIENHPNNYARFIEILEIVNVQGKNKYRISRDLHNNEDVAECLFIEDNWHPFNIQDAKDGDVLVHNSFMFDDFIFIYNNTSILQAYCYYSSEKNRFIVEDRGHYCPWNMQEVTPATKEQRDLLFSKMKEAGYKWDADKKELKKIEQKPTWSKEDAKKLSDILAILRGGENCYYNSHILVDWLKSLKERMGG